MNKPEGMDVVDYVHQLEEQIEDRITARAEDTLNILFRMSCILERLWLVDTDAKYTIQIGETDTKP